MSISQIAEGSWDYLAIVTSTEHMKCRGHLYPLTYLVLIVVLRKNIPCDPSLELSCS